MLNETLLVRFVWSELPNIGFGADASLTPQTNPVALTAPVGPNVQGMEIHLAVEKRFDIIQNLQQKIASSEGFSLLIPYCYTTTSSLTGTNQPFANSAIYNNDVASTNLEHFYTNINNTRRMQHDYYPGLNDDYKALRDKLIDSTIQTPNIHNYNWCWLDRFDDGSFGKMKFNKQTIIKTIPIGGIIPGDHGGLMVQINLDFVPDLITLKLYSLDGTLHIGDVYTIRTSLISDNNLFPFQKYPPQIPFKELIILNVWIKTTITFMTFTSIYDDKANILEAFIKSLQVKPNENRRSLILTNNTVAENSSSKKEVAPDYLIIFDDLSNELKDPSITKPMKIQRHFSAKIILSTQAWKDTSSHIRKVDKSIESNEMKTNTNTPQSGASTNNGNRWNNNRETINIAPTKSLFINEPSVKTTQISPLDFYEYFTHWIQFKYNISGGSFVYSMNQIHISSAITSDNTKIIIESCNILLYLAEKYAKFIPNVTQGRFDTLNWTFWQTSGLGPNFGNMNYFNIFAETKVPLAIERFTNETHRLFNVLNKRLDGRDYVVGDEMTIADFAIYPWARNVVRVPGWSEEFPNVIRYIATVRARPAVKEFEELEAALPKNFDFTPEQKAFLERNNQTNCQLLSTFQRTEDQEDQHENKEGQQQRLTCCCSGLQSKLVPITSILASSLTCS
ncbi:putative glutathione S transferase [Cavenderia fasciculata]|uniref:Glutathione S transferase n=1 Tax=Cavenderia fasciculata TaxID=261658 RepID=F4Q087_CACFS|nr:putative glutathione S transferase [Cavenderia fasciculata]EGG18238.1 putative glutathione S transferase [Cavenderia fasciculata]|eukprot:XP_004357061.1 putative glutathione S transferase [Cavenderia fasciculata]